MIIDDTSERLNLLVAYPYLNGGLVKTLQEHAGIVRLVVDSGAFTAWKAGKPIALDDYCRFLETLPVTPWRYFTLDVVGDPHGTLKNYETMLARGFSPVPIFTRGEDPSVLEHYYQTSDLVGIGGLVATKGNTGFVNGIMQKAAGRKVHLLGFTRIEFLRHYRPYMCDASSWESGARFASLPLYMGGGRFKVVTKKDFAARPPQDVAGLIRRYGIEPSELRFDVAWRGGYSANRRLCATSCVAFSLDVQRNLGTLVFLALTTPRAANVLAEGYAHLIKRGKA